MGTKSQLRGQSSLEDVRITLIGLCHDIRQSIAAGLLLARMPGDERFDESLKKRLDLMHAQFRIVDDLIAAELEDDEPRWWLLDPEQIIEDCAAVVRLTHGVTVETVVRGRSMMYGDPVLVHRVLANILDNASRAAGRGGTVNIRIERRHSEVWVEIEDRGQGFGSIPHGMGRGLTIVDAALKAQRGHLEISSADGKGTVVRIRLPNQEEGVAS